MYYIWYHYIDLDKEWSECRRAYNHQFPSSNPRNVPGLQCKFYRFLRKRTPVSSKKHKNTAKTELFKYGVVNWCKVWYPWMRPEHRPWEPTCESKTV